LWYLAQLANSNTTNCVQFDAISINDLDGVAFDCRDFNSFEYVYLSDQQGLHRILGFNSQLFGRTVVSAHIGREAINSDKHVAMLVDLVDGSAIVRADPTYIPPDLVATPSGAFQLEMSTGSSGSPSITTTIGVRSKLMLLSFDATFPNRTTGELRVKLGGKLLKSIAASQPGMQQHITMPIDLRKDSRRAADGSMDQLRFEIAGKPGAAVQISNVLIPGVISDSMQADIAKRWHVDTSKGGRAGFIDTTAFPVKLEVNSDVNQKEDSKDRTVSVTILSSDGFDATHDIDRSTLSFNGTLLEPNAKQNGAASPRCVARDVNTDKLPDLVCDVTLNASAKADAAQIVRVAAMSIYGWRIAGSNKSEMSQVQ
jgi:hypothetical protein